MPRSTQLWRRRRRSDPAGGFPGDREEEVVSYVHSRLLMIWSARPRGTSGSCASQLFKTERGAAST